MDERKSCSQRSVVLGALNQRQPDFLAECADNAGGNAENKRTFSRDRMINGEKSLVRNLLAFDIQSFSKKAIWLCSKLEDLEILPFRDIIVGYLLLKLRSNCLEISRIRVS
jgi:hypothetical protein